MSQFCEKIKVFARIRPSKEERVHKVVQATNNDITVNLDGEKKTFPFDGVFGEESTQEDVFNVAASRIIQGTLQGYNGTIFAYGQTGSGKTFTMIGPPSKYSQSSSNIFDEESGIIPRGLQSLFELLDKKKEEMPNAFSFNVSVSFIEIYNEHIYDLFVMSEEKLKIGQDHEGNAMVKGATERIVKDFSDAMTEVKCGWANRTCAETAMNRTSSRSHALLLIKIRTEEVHGSISTARSAFLNLVDLAGSERVKQSKVEGDKFKETTCINGSLLQLKNVIRELSDKKNKGGFINFRNSALTHILKDSLGGNARTAVMINVHPDKMYYSETLSTLVFSADVSTIENRVVVNEDLKGDSVTAFKAEIRRLTDEMEKMKNENSEEVAQLQVTLEKWKEAANKFERQLAVARRNAINAAIVARNGGDAAATLAESVWEKSMLEVAESARKLPNTNNIRSTQVRALTEQLNLCQFEKDELQIQLDDEKKSKVELQEKYTRCLEGARTPMTERKSKIDSMPSQNASDVSSMLGNVFETSFTNPEAAKKERRRTRYTPSRNRQSSFFKPVLDVEEDGGQAQNEPLETENVEERRQLDLEIEVNTQKQIIDEKTQESENLLRLLKKSEESISEAQEKLMDALKSSEAEKEKAEKLMIDMEKAEKTIGENREKFSELEKQKCELNEELMAARSQMESLTSDLALMKSTHMEEMEQLKTNLTSNLSMQEKKEVDLKSEIERLQSEIEMKRGELLSKETEKTSAVEVAAIIRDKLLETEADRSEKIQEVSLLSSQLEELRQTMSAQKKEMEEERRKREENTNEKISEIEREMDQMKVELEKERKKKMESDLESSGHVERLQEEIKELQISKEREIKEEKPDSSTEKKRRKDKYDETSIRRAARGSNSSQSSTCSHPSVRLVDPYAKHWETVSYQFSQKIDEMKKELNVEHEKRAQSEASKERMSEILRMKTSENEELKEDVDKLGDASSHGNSKQKIRMMHRYVEEKRLLKLRVNQLEASLEKHGITVPQNDFIIEGEEEEEGTSNNQRDSIASENNVPAIGTRRTKRTALSSSSADNSKTSVRSSKTSTAARK